jgi:hypothetical protein
MQREHELVVVVVDPGRGAGVDVSDQRRIERHSLTELPAVRDEEVDLDIGAVRRRAVADEVDVGCP